MHYLSVHDIVWINTTLTGKTVSYNYEKLEAAMAAQYSYGSSKDVAGQAANLLEVLLVEKPFHYGNRRTAFVATCAFLSANGYSVATDSSTIGSALAAVEYGSATSADAVDQIARPANTALRPGFTLRQLITHLLHAHRDTVSGLAERDTEPVAA
jgi:prophage maintenance system killer protein